MPDTPIQSDEVLIDRVGSAAVIRLNRPKALNSLSLSMVQAMKAALERFADDPEISCVVLKGEGSAVSAPAAISASSTRAAGPRIPRSRGSGGRNSPSTT